MNINLPVPAVEKLLDYFASGIGSTAGFFFSRMAARREAQAKLIAAEGEAEVQKALMEGQGTAMQIIAKAQAEARSTLISPNAVVQGEVTLTDLVTQRIEFQENKRQANIEAVVREAAEELEGKEVLDHEVDHDWTARFFNDVQDVSSEEMQRLWAKVLAGEVERPGSTSIRTLSILKHLDKAVADSFRALSSMCISVRLSHYGLVDARVLSLGGNASDNALSPYGLGFGVLNLLNEHGLIISDYNSWRDYYWAVGGAWTTGTSVPQLFRVPFSFQGRYWVLDTTSERNRPGAHKLHGVALTQSGVELLGVVGVEPMNLYTQALTKFLETAGLKLAEVQNGEPYDITDNPT